MHWTVIKWAKAQGYRHYDFCGISPDFAAAVLRGEPISGLKRHSVSFFKLGFGGEIA
jgi:lipid II:glycine glycyltransferase (peptidoglycan interpeptide bridge formation enzyme)